MRKNADAWKKVAAISDESFSARLARESGEASDGPPFPNITVLRTDNHFTDTELAAEFWRAESDYLRVPYRHRDAAAVKVETLHRFASTPGFTAEVEDYRRWVDEMVNRPESLRKARGHTPGKTMKRNPPKDEK